MRRTVFTDQHEAYRIRVRDFLEQEVVPQYPQWEKAGAPPRSFWRRAGEVGILGAGAPERFGGLPGADFRHSAVFTEEAQRVGLALGGVRVHTDICMPYFVELGTEEQQARWLPRLAGGEAVAALALSEPGAGSDLKALSTSARRDGDVYVVSGTKTFISNGINADLIILAVKTDRAAGREGISLLVVEGDAPGLTRGAPLQKIGLKAQDLAELFFDEVAVPVADRLGEENHGFRYLTRNLAQERLSIGLNSQAAAAAVLQRTIETLTAGEPRPDQQTKFELAACATEVQAGQALTDRALQAHADGELTPADAAMVKLFCTELQGRVTDRCVQLCGPAGYARSSPVARAYMDARVSRIYGGSSEIMKVIVAGSLGL
ncbi:MAG TPA: acyl-CoA dehydrogenase family protein [Solirubrobacteraceae bacterium]|nr:acyl-CoA dehydrogenase family protein [Solirubrobacteraceae bacterium]